MDCMAFNVTLPGRRFCPWNLAMINNVKSVGHPCLLGRLGFNMIEGSQMLGILAGGVQGNITGITLVPPLICGDALMGCRSADVMKLVKDAPQRSCLSTFKALAKKKHVQVAGMLNDDDKDEVSMEEWSLNKPLGFGQGKVYDTSLEDKLVEEIEHDKEARVAAVMKRMKNAEGKGDPKKTKKAKLSESPPSGVEVWVGNLPKKKNVERDLQSAFEAVPGLLHVRPIVLGNEKTRDPICKGFGFLTFTDMNCANSFIKQWEGEAICFGKVEKKLAYRIANREKTSTGDVDTSMHMKNFTKVPRLRVRDKTAVLINAMDNNTSIGSSTHVSTSEISPELQPELRSLSICDTDHFDQDDVEEALPVEDIWGDLEDEDDLAVDLELEQDKDVLHNAVDTSADTMESEKAHDFESRELGQGNIYQLKQAELGEDSVYAWQQGGLQQKFISADSGQSLHEERDGSSKEDGDWGLEIQASTSGLGGSNIDNYVEGEDQGLVSTSINTAGNVNMLQENIVNSLQANGVKKGTKGLQSQRSSSSVETESKVIPHEDGVSSHKDKEIEALETRVLKKFKNVGVPSKENNAAQQGKKKLSMASIKAKTSKQRAGSNLGSASRLKKKERDFIAGALSKYGKRAVSAE